MTEFVRVSDKTTGHHYSTTKQIAERSDHLTVLPDHPAVNNHGELLPPKFKTTPEQVGEGRDAQVGAEGHTDPNEEGLTMTLTTIPEGFSAAGKGSVFAAPAVADHSKPSVAEFAPPTGFNLSCDLMNWSYSIERSTVNQNRYCLAQAIQGAGRKEPSVNPITVVYNPQDPDDDNYVAYQNLKEGTKWVLFDRRGLDSRKSLAAAEVGDLIPVEVILVTREEIDDTEGALIRSTISFRVTGEIKQDVALVA